MQKGITAAKQISKDLKKDWLPYLEEVNLHRTFESIYYLGLSNEVTNTLVCAIIYSYDNESKWIDLKHDSFTINKNILTGLYADLKEEIYNDFIYLKKEEIRESIGSYLDLLPDWRFRHVRKLIDYYTTVMNEKDPDLIKIDEEKRSTVNFNRGKAIREAKLQRLDADELIKLIEKDFVSTNSRISQDFGENFSQKSIDFSEDYPKDDGSWRYFIKYTKPLWEQKKAT